MNICDTKITNINSDNEVISMSRVVQGLQQQGLNLIVNCKEAERVGADIRNNIKQLSKKIEEKRKSLIVGANEYLKNVNNIFKPILNNLDNIDNTVEQKMITYHNECIAESKRLVEEKEKEFQKALDEGNFIEDLEVKDIEKKVESDYGNKVSYVKKWVYRLIDINQVPAEYSKKVVDDEKIKYAIKIGRREIPGIEIYEETGTRRY